MRRKIIEVDSIKELYLYDKGWRVLAGQRTGGRWMLLIYKTTNQLS